jgi:predicted polyphosphate/ATP-dependent NAD kinase
LLVDSNDPELDQQWQGYIKVITGYRDAVMYRVSASGE